ncbi:MAG: GTPase Era [Flavobacteriales bacterium]
MTHRAGFVNIVGSPNVGKSTLMNRLVGERLSIITSKAQTTRHRIMGLVNGDDFQIVYSDTPGVLDPKYKLQEGMMRFVQSALQDADVLIVVTDIFEDDMNHPETLEKIARMEVPVFVLINKVDLAEPDVIEARITQWKERIPRAVVGPISALHGFNTENILQYVIDKLPESPPYFPKDELTTKPMRFFVSEIIREKILLNYKQEIPYSCEVVVSQYLEDGPVIRIRAEIVVARESQKGILIGHKGSMLKKVGTAARKDIEAFIDQKVFLELFVKVDKDWRNDDKKLKRFGYLE